MAQKKMITVTLEVRELKHDIMNRSHITGEVKEAEGKDYRAVSHMQASEDEGPDYQMSRSICNAFSHIKTELAEYLHEEGTTSNNRISKAVDESGRLRLTFMLPSNFDNSACDSIGGMLHEYIVNRTLSEWYLITDNEDAQGYAGMAVGALEQAKQALYKRLRPTRPIHTEQDNGTYRMQRELL